LSVDGKKKKEKKKKRPQSKNDATTKKSSPMSGTATSDGDAAAKKPLLSKTGMCVDEDLIKWADSFAPAVRNVDWGINPSKASAKHFKGLVAQHGSTWDGKKRSKGIVIQVFPSIEQQHTQQRWRLDPKNLACIPKSFKASAFRTLE
jgi:hypothetical protein